MKEVLWPLRNSGSLNSACLKCTSKTLHVKVWQSERWAQRQLLKFLLEDLEWRFTLLIFLSRRVSSPKSSLAEQSARSAPCPHRSSRSPPERRTVPWESTFSPPAVGNTKRRASPKSVRPKQPKATLRGFLVYVILCKKSWQPTTRHKCAGAKFHQDKHSVREELLGVFS